MMRARAVSVLLLLTLLPLALAKVPLGERVPATLRAEVQGPYWIVFYTRSCLEPAALKAHWQALRLGKRAVLAVNPVEVGNVAMIAPYDFRALTGQAALELSRSLRVRAYPTSVLIDADDVIRAAFEGPVTVQQVQESLNLLAVSP